MDDNHHDDELWESVDGTTIEWQSAGDAMLFLEPGDRKAYSQAFREQVKRREFPVEIRVIAVNIAEPPDVEVRMTFASEHNPAPPPNIVGRVVVRIGREFFSERWVAGFKSDVASGQQPFAPLYAVFTVDPAAFEMAASEYFANLDEAGFDALDLGQFARLVAAVNEHDAELWPRVVDLARQGGQRLRAMLIDITCDPTAADQMGFLSAAALRDRLEEQ